MFDLILATFLHAPVSDTQSDIQVLAQARAAMVYLPVTTKRDVSDPDCIVYTARNITRKKISNLRVNQRDNRGRVFSRSVYPSSLEPRETVSFSVCDNSFVNVGGNQ